MKRIKLFFIFLSVVSVSILYFTACNEKSDVNSPMDENFDTAQFSVIDIIDVQNGIEDGTLEKDMTFNGVLLNFSFMNIKSALGISNSMAGRNPWIEKYDLKKDLGPILRTLHLTKEQRASILDLTKAYHTTMKGLVQKFYDENKSIIDAANATRRAIADSVKNGLLTRAEAQEKIKALNQGTRDKIANSEPSQTLKAEMCTARKALLDGITGVLTTEQKAIWKEAIKAFPNPC